jgi:hypothetical protein
MTSEKVFFGQNLINSESEKVSGKFTNIEGERYYKIANYDHMDDFFMSIVSDANHWMFISSNGALSAGRQNRDRAIFPYYTEDKIHDYKGITGSRSIFLCEKNGRIQYWQPFSEGASYAYKISRNIYKSAFGNKILFEEINQDLELAFRYTWMNTNKYGFVKKSELLNLSTQKQKVNVLDGIQNILPSGTSFDFQNNYSNLLDAYKKNELDKDCPLALYTLSSVPVDRAEPSENLQATVVWSTGLKDAKVLLSNRQVKDFSKGHTPETEYDIRAGRGAFFLNKELSIGKESTQTWYIITDLNKDTRDISDLKNFILNEKDLVSCINDDIKYGTDRLKDLVASADGLQLSNEELNAKRHYSNTLFNIMRGGIYLDNYQIQTSDFIDFVSKTNVEIHKEVRSVLEKLPEQINVYQLESLAEDLQIDDFTRISKEYLPLMFSRRHGDPSRPWNIFSIDNKKEDGSEKLDFQGNWRDIFQNWEALSLSYPAFIDHIISKFLNASTADGYNPYRIMRSGIDWEKPDPDDPWAYIGYWGDHQIIYLQKLLELSSNHYPEKLEELLQKEIFAYANVPYRIKGFEDIVKTPGDTIEFNYELDEAINDLVHEMGSDGRLILHTDKRQVYHVNMIEKLLVMTLSKVSNLIPDAGIWLNTQRPEWNDANNALVGNGVSMVTLYYLYRFLSFWKKILISEKKKAYRVSIEVFTHFESTSRILKNDKKTLEEGFNIDSRFAFTEQIGKAGAKYREAVYQNGFSGNRRYIQSEDLLSFVNLTLKYLESSIQNNKDRNGLYHSYNLIKIKDSKIHIERLYEMLEGQVSVLSSGYLTAEESLEVLNNLKASNLFREDQYSYLLYPDRELPRFDQKNHINENIWSKSRILKDLISSKNESIIKVDHIGEASFNKEFRNAEILCEQLSSIKDSEGEQYTEEEINEVLDIYENLFNHASFTGRSGTFYAYEGLGSIYWHMVSKLLLAVQENFFLACDSGATAETIGFLKEHYYEIKAGIGSYKSPDLYGAFPTDPYSHTPGHSGVKQPGMTGQVKEDFISRYGELGLRIEDGNIIFDSSLINPAEFLDQAMDFEYRALNGQKKTLRIEKGQMAYTLCQIPIIYQESEKSCISIFHSDGSRTELDGNRMEKELSCTVFARSKDIDRIEVKGPTDNSIIKQ